MSDFIRNDRGSAVQWFALAALMLSVVSMAGARTLNWLSQSGRVTLVAAHAKALLRTSRTTVDVDRTPTGSIPAGALVIRLP